MNRVCAVLLVVLLGLVALPMVGTVLLQFYGAAMVASVAARLHPSPEPLGIPWNVVERRGARPGLAALANPAAFEEARRVEVTAFLTPEEIRTSEESLGSGERSATYAALRAPALARLECDIIETIFAEKCIVGTARARELNADPYAVSFTLLFTPKQPLGRIATSTKLAYLEIPVELVGSSRRISVSRPRQAAARRDLYEGATAACAAMRERYGNCGILSIRVHASRPAPSGPVEITGRAVLAILQETEG